MDWAGLEHVYETADDVPGLLRALRGADAEGRGKALHALYGNIFHQGSRYDASSAALPFLARMAADPSLPGRADALHLLAALAIGYAEAHLPRGVDVAAWRREMAEFRAKDEREVRAEYEAWVDQAGEPRHQVGAAARTAGSRSRSTPYRPGSSARTAS